MTQVEIFSESSTMKLERVTNIWLEEHQNIIVEDVKYSIAHNSAHRVIYSALIQYKTR